jgi:hypothetical protein
MTPKSKALKKLTNHSKIARAFTSHGSHLSDSEYQNSADKYDAQRRRRKN